MVYEHVYAIVMILVILISIPLPLIFSRVTYNNKHYALILCLFLSQTWHLTLPPLHTVSPPHLHCPASTSAAGSGLSRAGSSQRIPSGPSWVSALWYCTDLRAAVEAYTDFISQKKKKCIVESSGHIAPSFLTLSNPALKSQQIPLQVAWPYY